MTGKLIYGATDVNEKTFIPRYGIPMGESIHLMGFIHSHEGMNQILFYS